jgi:hypothetical protein
MKRSTELKRIIRLAQRRRDTLLRRLDQACERGSDARADQISLYLSYENELIYNATRDLEAQR